MTAAQQLAEDFYEVVDRVSPPKVRTGRKLWLWRWRRICIAAWAAARLEARGGVQ